MALSPAGSPVDAVAGKLELPGCPQKRRPVGIGDRLTGVREINTHVDSRRDKDAPAPL